MDRPHHLGEPIATAMRGRVALCLMLAVLMLAGCRDEPDNQETSEAVSLKEASVSAAPLEPVKRDIRIIGDGRLPAPRIESERIIRLPARESAEKRNKDASEAAAKIVERYARPVFPSAKGFVSGGKRIELAGIEAPSADLVCGEGARAWPCGVMARAALRRFVRTRTVTCRRSGDQTDLQPGKADGEAQVRYCHIGKTDLSAWLVERGWAKARSAKLVGPERLARKAGLGLWRDCAGNPSGVSRQFPGECLGDQGAGLSDPVKRDE